MSYEELLEIMKIKYFEICGHHVVGASETGIRLQVIADAIVKVKDKLIYFYNNKEGGLCKIKMNGKGFGLVNKNIHIALPAFNCQCIN